jgi:hypothetical protein
LHTRSTYHLICDSGSEPGSVLLAVTDDTGRVVGAAGLVAGETWRLASFAVHVRDATVAAALCHGIVQTLRVNRVRSFTATVDAQARELLASFGLFPAAGSVAGLLDLQRRTNPEGFRLVTQGYGLDDVELPYPAELLTAPATAPVLAG